MLSNYYDLRRVKTRQLGSLRGSRNLAFLFRALPLICLCFQLSNLNSQERESGQARPWVLLCISPVAGGLVHITDGATAGLLPKYWGTSLIVVATERP